MLEPEAPGKRHRVMLRISRAELGCGLSALEATASPGGAPPRPPPIATLGSYTGRASAASSATLNVDCGAPGSVVAVSADSDGTRTSPLHAGSRGPVGYRAAPMVVASESQSGPARRS